jgi:outer membrane protein TolC
VAAYRDALRKLEAANGLLAVEQNRLDAAQESFDTGAGERLDLLQAQSEFHVGELARAAAVIEAQKALGSLEDAIERPLDGASGTASFNFRSSLGGTEEVKR